MEGPGSQASPAPNLRDSLQKAMGDWTQLPWSHGDMEGHRAI